MDFEHSARSRELQERLLEFMDAHIYPNERRFHEEIEANRSAGNAWQPTKVIEELKPKARAAGLWNLFLPRSSARSRRGLVEPRLCAAVRNHGPGTLRPRSVQLLSAGHRQHGDVRALRIGGAQAPMARPTAAGRDSLCVPDDRARRRLVRRHQRPGPHRAARRQLRDQWTQMVVERRRRSALQGLHRDGQDRPRRRAPQTAIHDRRTLGRTRHHGRAASVDLRLRRRPARTHAGLAQRRCGAG